MTMRKGGEEKKVGYGNRRDMQYEGTDRRGRM